MADSTNGQYLRGDDFWNHFGRFGRHWRLVEEQFAVIVRNVSWKSSNSESKFRITVLKFAMHGLLACTTVCTYWLSGRAGRENIWFEVRTEGSEVRTSWPWAKYFPVRPNLTQSISILSYDHSLLKILKTLVIHIKIRRLRARNNYMKVSPGKFVIYFFASNKKLTVNRKAQLMVSFLFFNCNSYEKANRKLT